ncbi:MAG: hypothetical protein AAB645_00920 [Patescibacteria group bacterium]
MNTPIFSRLASCLRTSTMPEEMRNELLLLFFRMTEEEQAQILKCLETNPDTLPLFAEMLTELKQENINLTDTEAVANLLERYLEKLKK